MGKRKPDHPRPDKGDYRDSITRQEVDLLRREATNVRRRINAFNKANSLDLDISGYRLNNLLTRLETESFSEVIKDLKSITRESLNQRISLENDYNDYEGSSIDRLIVAVEQANRNIREARNKYADFIDVLPKEFKIDDIMTEGATEDYINRKIDDLGLFTPENLIPTAINNDGEAGTIAEYNYYKNILDRENKRREEVRKENDPRTNEGFFRQQADYDTQPINIDNIRDIESLRKRAETWDDPARLYRANMFLSNYEKALGTFESSLIKVGMYNSTIEDRIDFIREVIGNLYFNEKAITYASTRVPNINISIISPPPGIGGNVDFKAIYEAWIYIQEEFLE